LPDERRHDADIRPDGGGCLQIPGRGLCLDERHRDDGADTQTGTYLFACCGTTAPQIIDVDSGTAFADVLGSPPQARIVRAVHDFVMLGDLSTGRNRIRWSGLQDFNSATAWTVGTKFCDEKIFPSDGFVTGITRVGGGLGGLILLSDATYKYQRVASRSAFEFFQMEKHSGTNSPASIVELNQTAFYYGLDGFQTAGTEQFEGDVGVEYVDEYFAQTANVGRPRMICGARDPTRPRIMWLYPSTGNNSYYLDRLIGYDKMLQRWFKAEFEASIMFPGAAIGSSLDDTTMTDIDMDSEDASLDSSIYQGGQQKLAGFNANDELVFFSGPPMAARLQTPLFEPIPGKRAYINGFRPVMDAVNVSGRVAMTERPMTPENFVGAQAVNFKGQIPQRTSGRYMRAEVNIPAGEPWLHALGTDFMDDDIKSDGER
jgi:hypothetical protein